jgi:hypothetical protein
VSVSRRSRVSRTLPSHFKLTCLLDFFIFRVFI